MLLQSTTSPLPFQQWALKTLENRRLLWLSGIAIVLQFITFKIYYPFPNFIPDSYSYMEAAFKNQTINTWPIGYSNFLRLLSSVTNHHVSLVAVQYVLVQAAGIWFVFSMGYLLGTGKWLFRILLTGCVLNPLLLHVSNFASSDALFTALSLVWITQLLWIIYRPTMKLLLWHGVVLTLAFMVRYNALYYPLISILVIVFANLRRQQKWAGIGFMLLLLGAFVGRTQYQYFKSTGRAQFSAFGGWQLAANALYGYAHAKKDAVDAVPWKFRELHAMVNKHLDSMNKIPWQYRPDRELGIYYLWDEKAPLKQYMKKRWEKDTTASSFKRWGGMGKLYSEYGSYLIKAHPGSFVQHYMVPNLVNYYVPKTEFLTSYNMGKDSVDAMAVTWFGLPNNKVRTLSRKKEIVLPAFFPILLAVINLVFVMGFISFAVLGGFKKASNPASEAIGWLFIIWLGNMGFSVFASFIVLRYQLFPMIITLAFATVLMTWMMQEAKGNLKIDGFENLKMSSQTG